MSEAGLEVVLACADLAASLDFYTQRLGLRLLQISPADDPAVALLEGRGVRLRLSRCEPPPAPAPPASRVRLRLAAAGAERIAALERLGEPGELDSSGSGWRAPEGTEIELTDPVDGDAALPWDATPMAPEQTVVTKAGGGWVTGRAGMHYRDLVPDRRGGRFIASHIRIPVGGPVPDDVHFHRIHFQLIFCVSGWVRVVYEDQGPPFVLEPGDCVLQPPGIRHRVLEASDRLDVIEVTCPAVHDTFLDHARALPSLGDAQPHRRYGDQTFRHHRSVGAAWSAVDGATVAMRSGAPPVIESCELGFDAPTNGLASGRLLRRDGDRGDGAPVAVRPGALRLLVVLDGTVDLHQPGAGAPIAGLGRLDAVAVARGADAHVEAGAAARWLEVTVREPGTAGQVTTGVGADNNRWA